MQPESASPQSNEGKQPTETTVAESAGQAVDSPRDQAIKLFDELELKHDEEDNTETAPQETAEPEKKDDKAKAESKDTDEEPKAKDESEPKSVSKAFAAIAEKEARFQGKKRDLEERARSAEQRAVELQASFEQLKQNPLEFMSQLGLDLDSVLKAAADPNAAKNQPGKDAPEAMAEVKRLRKEIADSKQKEAEQKALSQLARDISDHVTGDEPKYELILRTDKAKDQVLELIDAYYAENDKLLSVEEAANMVESELRAMEDKWFESDYVKSKIASLKVNGSDGESDGANKKTEGNSLSNSMTQATAPANLTDEQRTAMAIKMFAERSVDME